MDLIAVHCLAPLLALLCITLTPPCDLFAPAVALLCTSNLDFQNGCCFMLLKSHCLCNVKYKMLTVEYYISIYLSVILQI